MIMVTIAIIEKDEDKIAISLKLRFKFVLKPRKEPVPSNSKFNIKRNKIYLMSAFKN
jgi:hypothetical protein